MDEMNLTDSLKLLRDYADRGDEAAFRKLVEQYLDLVYSAALRRVNGDTALAQDVTQMVFTDLARKAPSLRGVEMLGGWLHRHTGFVASNMVRSEHRRQVREQESAQMNATSESSDALWQQLAPMLDDTIESLEPTDRQAVLLRFFERRDFRTIGAALDISDDAAQKRVSRALEKLRALLTERGVTLSFALLSGLLLGKAVTAAPAGMAASVSQCALSSAVSGGLWLTIFKLIKSIPFKITVGGAVAAVALWLALPHHSASTSVPRGQMGSAATLASATNAPTTDIQSFATSTSHASDTNATGKVLLLKIVAADSGKPVPNVNLDYMLTENGKYISKSLQANRFGVCKVPVPDDISELTIKSGRDGFADTLLDWNPGRGEQIPAQYTLKLARAVSIGGQVVDPDGTPVEGARVWFDTMPDLTMQTRPQSDDFSGRADTARSDTQGRWQINRFSKEAVRTIYGGASHPDFVDSMGVWPSRDAMVATQLFTGTYVFKLGHAVTVQGIVKDPNGNPVPDASVLIGRMQMEGRRGKSQNDGTFSIVGCTPGKSCITAEIKGYAATTRDVELTDNSGPFEIVLRPGKLLKLRVVNEEGNPVPNAAVSLDTFPNRSMEAIEKEPAPAQTEFNGITDANGRLQWDNAPDEELTFDVSADGYMHTPGVKVRPDGTEHTIKLGPALTISGTVSDATTGQPIPSFRIVAGWPEFDPSAYPTNISWSKNDNFLQNFAEGKFQVTYGEPILSGAEKQTYVFKFKADGYVPFITRSVQASERSARFDVVLTPAAATQVTVLDPDNEPAAETDIGLVSPGASLSLVPGGFAQYQSSGGAILFTDNHGQFSLAPDPEVTKIVAAGPQGYAEATPAELAANPVMNLQPWGRLEGTYTSNGLVVAGCTLSFKYSGERINTIWCDPAFHVRTDSQGHFIFNQVPPGKRIVTFVDNLGNGASMDLPLQPVTINPGTTTTVSVDYTNISSPIPTSVSPHKDWRIWLFRRTALP